MIVIKRKRLTKKGQTNIHSTPFYLQGVDNVRHEFPVGVPDRVELVLVVILLLELTKGCLELDEPAKAIYFWVKAKYIFSEFCIL